jgi:tRNA(Ile)-lysidine synthase
MNIDREAIIISPKTATTVQAVIDESCRGPVKIGTYQFQISCHKVEKYQIDSHKDRAAFDFEKFDFPLKVRNWLPGDRFCPLGMTHQKKLSDFFIDNKVPQNIKSEILVLVSGKDIAWVIGHRIDDRYKVTAETRKVLEIAVD